MKQRVYKRPGVAWVACALVAAVVAFALQGGLASSAYAEQGGLMTMASIPQTQADISGAGMATVKTDAEGDAYVKVAIGEAGVYSITSTASEDVDGDTIGYLYDSSMSEIEESDDCHADTNFCICADLAAGTYYLKVTGKETQADASISVSVQKGQALASLDYRCDYDGDAVSTFELGTWVQGEKTEWVAADSASFEVIGYVDRSVFIHAQESGAVGMLAWKNGLPKEQGRFAVMVSAKGGAYLGSAYYFLDEKASSSSLAELDPVVTTAMCNAIASVELGNYTTVPTNWSSRWDAITAGYYNVVGYCTRSKFEALGGDEASITWTTGLPNDEGEYVVKCVATNVDGNPYTGYCYVWTAVEDVAHAGSGSWVVDKPATYDTAGQHHLVCAYCGAACDYAEIAPLKDSLETAGSGATAADYKVLSSNTVRYEVCLSTKNTATVPAKVTIDGTAYKVVSIAPKAFAGLTKLKSVKMASNVATIGKNAFKGCKSLTSVTVGSGVKSIGASAFQGCKKLKTLTLKTKKLTAKGVKKCLTGSSVKTVKAPKAKKKAYAKLFVKKTCGKTVTVK